MLRRTAAITVALATVLAADTLVTKAGRRVDGTYLGGNTRQVRMEVGERVETFNVSDVESIRFGDTEAAAQSTTTQRPRERVEITRPEREISRPAVAQSATQATRDSRVGTRSAAREVPAGTNIVIRLIDDVDSERDRPGQTYRASIDESVVLDGETVMPRGSDVIVRLVEDRQSGKLTGKTELTLDVDSISVNGRNVEVATETVTQASESRTTQTAKVAGGTAALGAIIGAIAGGGKGAAIGAVTGAAAGGAVQVITKGQRVRIPSETRLTFALERPVRI